MAAGSVDGAGLSRSRGSGRLNRSRLTDTHIIYMVFHMKTTLNINDGVMSRLREEAARRGVTMSALVEAGLRRVLDESAETGDEGVGLPKLPSWSSGGTRVDVASRDDLYAAMEGR